MAVGFVIAGLVYGSPILIPLAVALFLSAVLQASIEGFRHVQLGSYRLPPSLAVILGVGSVLLGLYLIVSVLLGQIDALSAAWPRYVSRLEAILSGLAEWLGPAGASKMKEMISEIDLARRIPGLLSSTQSLLVSSFLVCAYMGFLFAEQGSVKTKVSALFPDKARADETVEILSKMSTSVQRYIWIKSIVSVLTGTCSYVVLRWLGVDFAETWALLIFTLNYIPNIGSILAVTFPALIALVQFDTPATFLILVTTLTAIQIAIGNILEPVLMGKTLNMSPLAIIVNLAFWGLIWGVAGMFLSVPILVIIIIVCSNVPSWRWVAVLLSRDGTIST